MTMMTTSSHELFVDFETYSSADITKCGAFRYVEAQDFCILLLAFAYGDEPVRVLDLTDPKIDMELYLRVVHDLTSPECLKVAHNCAFERLCIRRGMDYYSPIEEWEDTMILAAMNGLPMSLDGVGEALRLKDKKLKEGTALINYFSKPKPRTGGRRSGQEAPEKWSRFMEYCKRDVEVMRAVYRRLKPKTIVPETERRVFEVDCHINERGVKVDTELAEAAIHINTQTSDEAAEELRVLTGLDNPNSVMQLKEWLADNGLTVDSLDKAAVGELLTADISPAVRRVLELRKQLGKTSVSKYEAMLRSQCADGRVRGLTQYYGAGRTGRWAGRLVQLQNLPQNHLDDISVVREIVKRGDIELLELLYDSIPDTLSQLIRTALIAEPGHTFLVADYSAIEARVTAYLACVKWRMDTFAKGGDIYCQSASQMFHVPVEKHGVNGHLRQKGKVAELACGYGGGVGALKAFGADKMGLTEQEMQTIVINWRAASPEIPRLWRDVETRAKNAIKNPGYVSKLRRKYYDPGRASHNEAVTGGAGYSPYFMAEGMICEFKCDTDGLRVKLPSGRVLTYWGAELDDCGQITYMAQNQTTRKWEKTDTWGGKLVENIVQAWARDCLAAALVRLDDAGYKICFHVHDEIIAEAPEGSDWRDMAKLMSQPVPWAPGLLLTADGYSTPFYMKD